MTDEELAAIEQLVQAATPGPWRRGADWLDGPLVDVAVGDATLCGLGPESAQTVADGEFIAAARQDVPALLAEVRRLKASIEPPGTFTCKARSGGDPAEPQDCDWPVCGCDEHASKVIAALQECGWDKRSNQP